MKFPIDVDLKQLPVLVQIVMNRAVTNSTITRIYELDDVIIDDTYTFGGYPEITKVTVINIKFLGALYLKDIAEIRFWYQPYAFNGFSEWEKLTAPIIWKNPEVRE